MQRRPRFGRRHEVVEVLEDIREQTQKISDLIESKDSPPPNRLLQHVDVFTATADDPDLFRSTEVYPDEVWRIDHYSIRLVTDEASLLRSYISMQNGRLYLREWVTPANPFMYTGGGTIYLLPGQRLGIEISGADSGDMIELHYTGVRLPRGAFG